MPEEKQEKSSLGLGDILHGSSRKEAVITASPEVKPAEESGKETAKVENKTEIKASDSAGTKKEVKEKETSEEKKESVQSKPESDWEAEDNPYRKRYKDTAMWANQINQQNAEIRRQNEEMKRQVEILGKKIDGTYDPDRDEAKGPDQNMVRREAEVLGKITASESAAKSQYGEETVNNALIKFQEIYGENRQIQTRVLLSDAPVIEAMLVMREHEFKEQYGNDPNKIKETIRAEVEKELEAVITERVTKTIMERVDKKNKEVTGLKDAKGADHQDSPKKPVRRELGQILSSLR